MFIVRPAEFGLVVIKAWWVGTFPRALSRRTKTEAAVGYNLTRSRGRVFCTEITYDCWTELALEIGSIDLARTE